MSYTKWFADDKLMALSLDGFIPDYIDGTKTTVRNDNGFVYRDLYVSLRGIAPSWVEEKIMDSMAHKSIPGLYHRQPGRDGTDRPGEDFEKHAALNSHDNLEMMACSSIDSGLTWRFKEVIKHWPVINNIDPGKVNWHSIHTRTPSGIMGPASWFLFYIAAGQQPGWISTIAYCINLMVTAFVYKHYTHHSEHWRSWRRNKTVRTKLGFLTEGKAFVVGRCMNLFDSQIKKKSGGISIYFSDFIPEHPCRILGTKLK